MKSTGKINEHREAYRIYQEDWEDNIACQMILSGGTIKIILYFLVARLHFLVPMEPNQCWVISQYNGP